MKERENLEEREKELKRKETLLEKKLRDFYKKSKTIEKERQKSTDNQSTLQMDISDLENDESTEKIVTEKPIEIVIKVKNQRHQTSPPKTPKKRPITTDDVKERETDHVSKSLPPLSQSPQVKETKEPPHIHIHQQEDGSTTMTSYRSPPHEIHTPLTNILNEKHHFFTTKDSYREKLKKVHDENEIQKSSIHMPKTTTITHPKTTHIHPQLTHYIQRLLGMSHHAIEMLGVSTSEIETPSSSIINNSANISAATTESDSFERTKIERLKKFIQDNYKFLDEVDETLKKDTSTASSDSSNAIKTIERIWKQTLKESAREKEKTKKQIKPILKKVKTPKKNSLPATTVEKICQTERPKSPCSVPPSTMILASRDKQDSTEAKISARSSKGRTGEGTKKFEVLGRYDELAENCTQRIAELNQMITKVREEKQKILEITLSSGGDTARTSTEYADFCENQAFDRSESSKICDKKVPSSHIRSPEKVPLEKNKITGMSRDSGISLSRPVTALDSRESPDIPSSMQEDFEPILKDIPKPSVAESTVPAVQIISPSPLSTGIIDAITICSKPKKEKPPASLGRYSPQFGDELQLPHELSTIVEVDTPATSRLNTSATDRQKDKTPTTENMLEIEKIIEEITYQRFPSFHEYVKQNKLDLTIFDQDTISQIQIEYDELVSRIEKSQRNIENCKLSDLSNEIKNLVESMKLFNHSLKRFPTQKEYLEQMGMTDSIDSKSIDAICSAEEIVVDDKQENKHSTDAKLDAVSSEESLLDVIKELKQRNMLQHSFQYKPPEKLGIETSDDLPETTTSSSNQNRREDNLLKSKKKIHDKTKQKFQAEDTDVLSGIGLIPVTTASSQSTDDIGKDLEKMGLTWAAAMMRKSQENRKEFASTTSSSVSSKRALLRQISKFDEISTTIKQELSDITNDSIDFNTGRPLNLREFLAKELKKRTTEASSSISSSSNGSSITSQFLQSLLGSSSGTRSSSFNKQSIRETIKSTDRVKTSTPVNTRSSKSSSHHSTDSHHTPKFFSGDSHPSSVRYSSSDKSRNGENEDDRNPNEAGKTQSQSS